MSIINKIWKTEEKKLPCTNCIVFGNDNVIILDFVTYYESNTKKSSAEVSPLCDTTISSILKYNPCENWVWVDIWNELIADGKQKFVCGEGSYGNEGFVACEDLEENLIWGMFFDQTNPIAELKIIDNTLIGITEHRESQIEINLEDITDIKFIIYDRD